MVDNGQELGISIRGGAEHGLGVYVSFIEEGSVAEAYGLKVHNIYSLPHDIQLLGIDLLVCVLLLLYTILGWRPNHRGQWSELLGNSPQ